MKRTGLGSPHLKPTPPARAAWLWIWVVLLPAGAGPAGCARSPAVPQTLTPQQIEALEARERQADPFLRTQIDVGLTARLVDGERVEVSIINQTDRPLALGPKLFCVMNLPSRTLHRPLAVSQRRFPVLLLEPGEQASGELTFAPGILRPGSWLVYHNPNDAALHPARAEVR